MQEVRVRKESGWKVAGPAMHGSKKLIWNQLGGTDSEINRKSTVLS